MNFTILDAVNDEIEAERMYYNSKDAELGDRFVQEVIECFELIKAWPDVFKKLKGGYRQVGVKVFPHAVVYKIFKGDIYVVAVAPYKKHPYYWRSRKLK
jgi:hypothetical protein